MVDKDIKFKFKTKNGDTVEGIILCKVNIDDDEINVIYKNSNDSDDILRYGKIINYNDNFVLTYDVSEEEKIELMEEMNKEIIKMAAVLSSEEGN